MSISIVLSTIKAVSQKAYSQETKYNEGFHCILNIYTHVTHVRNKQNTHVLAIVCFL